MFRTIYWAYKTQFRYTKDMPLFFRLQHAFKMGLSTYRMPKVHRNRLINRQLKHHKKLAHKSPESKR